MSDAHMSPQPWKVNENAEANQWYITDADGKWVIGLILNGEMFPKRQKAVLDRVAACVNACEGINPEAVPELLALLNAVVGVPMAAVELARAGIYDGIRSALAKAVQP